MRVRTIRPGRKVQWIEAALLDEDEREIDARDGVAPAQRRRRHERLGRHRRRAAAAARRAATPPELLFGPSDVGYLERARRADRARATGREPGPGIAWFRLRCPVVAGEDLSPCSRVAACADFGSGVGNPLRFTHATGINADVTIALHRHPIGEWVCLESGSWVNPHGVGLAETRLHDERGPIGRGVQTLLVEPIGKRPSPMASRRRSGGLEALTCAESQS